MNQQGFRHICGNTCLASQLWCPFCPQHIIQYAAEQRRKVGGACHGQGDPNPSGSGSDLRRAHRVTKKKGEAESHRGNAGVKTRPVVFIKGRWEEVRVGPCAPLSWSDCGLDLLGRSAEGVTLSISLLICMVADTSGQQTSGSYWMVRVEWAASGHELHNCPTVPIASVYPVL